MADQLTGLGTITDILRNRFDWSNIPQGMFELQREIVNFPGTVDSIVLFSEERPHRYEIEYFFDSKADEYAFINFFYGRQGDIKKFWVPAQIAYFTLDVNIANGATSIIVKKCGYAKFYKGYERIYIRTKAGDLLTFALTNVVDGPLAGQETLSIGTAINRAVAISEVEIISFLLLARFDNSEIDMDYETDLISSVKTAIVELVKEYP